MAEREDGVAEGASGFYLQFDIPVAERAAVEGLENKPQAIELVAVRPPAEGDEMISATVFVPERAAAFFAQKIEAYRDEETRTGKPKNEALIARIDDVRLGVVRSLFTDDLELYPTPDKPVWWEVWLRDDRLKSFRRIASRMNITLKHHTITFPERDVVLALADEAVLTRLVTNTDAIAELRVAKDTPSLFLDMRPIEQADWVEDLAQRTRGRVLQRRPSACSTAAPTALIR